MGCGWIIRLSGRVSLYLNVKVPFLMRRRFQYDLVLKARTVEP